MSQSEKSTKSPVVQISSQSSDTHLSNNTSRGKVKCNIQPSKSTPKLKFTKGNNRKMKPLGDISKYIHIGKTTNPPQELKNVPRVSK